MELAKIVLVILTTFCITANIGFGFVNNRVKRDKDYHVKCHQSYTGMEPSSVLFCSLLSKVTFFRSSDTISFFY